VYAVAVAIAALAATAPAAAYAQDTGHGIQPHHAGIRVPHIQPHASSSWYLNIDGQAQQQTNWCWAATGDTIAAYFGYTYSQNAYCDMAFGYSTNVSCPNDQATLGNEQRAFQTMGLDPGYYQYSSISYSTLVSQISQNKPVNTRIQWSSGGGDMMTLYGYDTSNSTVAYYDPWPSDSRYNQSTYSYYVSNNSFSWTHSLYRIGG